MKSLLPRSRKIQNKLDGAMLPASVSCQHYLVARKNNNGAPTPPFHARSTHKPTFKTPYEYKQKKHTHIPALTLPGVNHPLRARFACSQTQTQCRAELQIGFRTPSTQTRFRNRKLNLERPGRHRRTLFSLTVSLAVEVPDVLQAVDVPHAREEYEPNQCQHVVPAGFRHVNTWRRYFRLDPLYVWTMGRAA